MILPRGERLLELDGAEIDGLARADEALGGRAQGGFALSDQALQSTRIGHVIGEQAAIAARFIGSREPPTGGKPVGGKPQSIPLEALAFKCTI
jgi:hypothetical protein